MLSEDAPTKQVSQEPVPSDATRRVPMDGPIDGTRRIITDEVLPEGINPLGYLQPGSMLLNAYEVVETLHPHETERAGIFVCRQGERTVVLKVAALLHPPKPELWDRLASLDHPNVLKVYETLQYQGLYYEIQEYCAGRSLSRRLKQERFSPDWVMATLVPQVNEGLKYLHEQGIVHRDIKPANIYLRQDALSSSVVVGDFDISSVIASDRTSRDTKRGAGTWEYMPPEAFPRFVDSSTSAKAARVTRTADYYSLGITIIELVLGTTSLHSSDLADLFDFYLSGGQIELPTGPQPLVRLLRGLLIRDRHKRWGPDQVDRWIEQKNTYDDVQAILDDEYFSLKRAVNPYTIGAMHATDLASLAEVLDRHPDEAFDDLFKSNRLTTWVGGIDMNVARHIEKDREIWRAEPDNSLFRCIMLLDRTRPFPVLGLGKAKTKREWLEKIVSSGLGEEQLAAGPLSFAEVRKLDSWLNLKPDAEPELAARVGATLWFPSLLRLEEIAYIFDPTLRYSHTLSAVENLRLPEHERTGGRTPQEVAQQALGRPEDWKDGIPDFYQSGFERWKSGFLEAWMRQRGLGELAQQARAAAELLKEYPYAAFESFLRVLDPSLPKLQVHVVAEDVGKICVVKYREIASTQIRYYTEGAGIPFGSLRLAFTPEGITLRPLLLDSRQGTLTFTVDSRLGIPVSTAPRVAAVEIHNGNCKLAGDRPVLRYRIEPSNKLAGMRLAMGAGLGFLVMGGARLGIHAATGLGAIPPGNDASELMNRAARWRLPENPYILAFLLAAFWLYVGFRVWLWGLRRSEL
jgi:serine/threonine protein kinase